MTAPALPLETWLRPVVESSPDGILVVVNSVIRYANPAVAQAVGAADPVLLVGHPVMALFDPDSRALILERIDRAVRGENPSADALAVVHLNSASFDYEVRVSVLDDSDPPAVALILHDVTERRQGELHLRANE